MLIRNFFTLAVIFLFSCKKQDDFIPANPVKPTNPGTPLATTIYYVDGAAGNDQNDGLTTTTAWKTIQKSFDAASAGSTVQIRGGTYYEELAMHVSGTVGNPITFTNYNNEVVIIDGSKIAGTTILSITDKSFLNIQNLTIQNLTKNNAKGILLAASPNGAAANLNFHNIVFKNINWTSSATAIPTSGNNAQPFIAFGYGSAQANAISNLTIDSCEFSNNITGFSESLSVDGNIDGFTITNNRVHDNTNIGIVAEGHYGTSANPQLDQARNGIIRGNTCFKNISLYATSGGIYVDGGRDIKVDRNTTYQNGYGIEVGNEKNDMTSNITVTNNLIYLNRVSGLAIGGYDPATTGQVVNCVFRNNSFYQNNTNMDGSGEIYVTKASNCIIGNNVIYTNSQNILFTLANISPQSGNSLDYNGWFTVSADPSNMTVNWRQLVFRSFSAYKTGTGQDAHSPFQDPLYTSVGIPNPDLHLKTGSPCLRAGNTAWITDPAEKDFDGRPRVVNGAVDIGAYELQ